MNCKVRSSNPHRGRNLFLDLAPLALASELYNEQLMSTLLYTLSVGSSDSKVESSRLSYVKSKKVAKTSFQFLPLGLALFLLSFY